MTATMLLSGMPHGPVYAAWHEQQPGSGVAAHYVHLTGFGGDNEINLKNLLNTRQACVRLKTEMGQLFQPLPPDKIPKIVVSFEVEIYYTANRTLDVQQSALYSIDMANCALVSTPSKILKLRSSLGRCDIDLIKKEARGQCDAAAHARASAWSETKLVRPAIPSVDMDKVLANMRAQVQTQSDQLKQQSSIKPQSVQGGQALKADTRTIAGTTCVLHRNAAAQAELCVAHPAQSMTEPLSPYPIPAAHLNGGVPGVLVDVKTPALTLRADHVTWNMSVSADVFSLPSGIDVRNILGVPGWK